MTKARILTTPKPVALLPLVALLSAFMPQASSAAHADPHWNYHEQRKWALTVDPTYSPKYPYAECGIGQRQSPVNIDMPSLIKTDEVDELSYDYPPIPLSVSNNGHTIRVNIADGHLHIGKNAYSLVQYHFHAPSEHHLNGISYPLEIHFVHGTEDGRLAVIAVFMQVGDFNPEFQKILDASPQKAGETVNAAALSEPLRLLPANRQHFITYAGSLTTPPCSEGVQWFVLTDAIPASARQIEQFDHLYHHNVRDEQKLNGRHLLMH